MTVEKLIEMLKTLPNQNMEIGYADYESRQTLEITGISEIHLDELNYYEIASDIAEFEELDYQRKTVAK